MTKVLSLFQSTYFIIISLVLLFSCDTVNIFGTSQLPYVPNMTYVQGGSFTMGDAAINTGTPLGNSVHLVTITYNLYIGTHEVTQGEFNNYNGTAIVEGSNFPIRSISWRDAIEYCNWLSRQSGLPEAYEMTGGTLTASIDNVQGFRLPSEAEWEFVARNRGTRAGNECSGGTLASIDNFGWRGGVVINEVATKLPNELGIYDMTGNVSEYTHDFNRDYTIAPAESFNPLGQETAIDTGNVHVRGGNYFFAGDANFRTSQRWWTGKEAANVNTPYIGFRIVRTDND